MRGLFIWDVCVIWLICTARRIERKLNWILFRDVSISAVQVINFSSGQVGYGQNEFTKRVGFSVTMPSANLSFYINDTREADSGLYSCIVIIPGAPTISGRIQLDVKGKWSQDIKATSKAASDLGWSAGQPGRFLLKIGKSGCRFTGSAKRHKRRD